jgi:hypothetical protein
MADDFEVEQNIDSPFEPLPEGISESDIDPTPVIEALDEADQVIADAESTISADLSNNISQGSATLATTENEIRGSISEELNLVDKTLDDLSYQIESNLAGDVGESLELASHTVSDIPLTESMWNALYPDLPYPGDEIAIQFLGGNNTSTESNSPVDNNASTRDEAVATSPDITAPETTGTYDPNYDYGVIDPLKQCTIFSPAPPGIDHAQWCIGNITCQQFMLSAQQWLADNNYGKFSTGVVDQDKSSPWGTVSVFDYDNGLPCEMLDVSTEYGTSTASANYGGIPTGNQLGIGLKPIPPYDKLCTYNCALGGAGSCKKEDIKWFKADQIVPPGYEATGNNWSDPRGNNYSGYCYGSGGGGTGGTGGLAGDCTKVWICNWQNQTNSTGSNTQSPIITDTKKPTGNFEGKESEIDCSVLDIPLVTTPQSDVNALGQILGVADKEGKYKEPDWIKSKDYGTRLVFVVLGSLTWAIGGLIDSLYTIAKSFGGCLSPKLSPLNMLRDILRVIGIVAPSAVESVAVSAAYQAHLECPLLIPTAEQATQCYLANTIDTKTYECWVAANNNKIEDWNKVRDANQTKLGVTELLMAWRRDLITTEDRDKGFRRLGYLDSNIYSTLEKITVQIPPISELIRYMVRDTGDQELVDKFGLDSQFDQKWTGELKEWGKNQGIDDKFARYSWRAHWSIPSPTQLYEMYHRLRFRDPNDPAFVDEPTIKEALIQQDILPFWIDKYLAISFRPLTRVDTRRAYDIGSLQLEDVRKSYLDQGYDETNADILTRFTQGLKIQRVQKHPAIKRVISGELTTDQFRNILTSEGYGPLEIERANSRLGVEIEASKKKACLNSVKKRYLTGEISDANILGTIQNYTGDETQTKSLAERWQCEKNARGKSVPYGTLCNMYFNNILSSADLYQRLLNLGYTTFDAKSLTAQCAIRRDQADQKKLEQLRRKEAADLRRQTSEERRKQREEKSAVKEAERIRDEQLAEQEAAEKLATARSNILFEASRHYADRNKIPLGNGVQAIQGVYNSFADNYDTDIDTILRAILQASQSHSVDTVETLSTEVEALLSGGISPVPITPNEPSSS